MIITENYLDLDVAYLLGLITIRGTFYESQGDKRIVIEFPFKSLVSGLKTKVDQKEQLDIAANRIRDRLSELIEADISVARTDGAIKFSIRFLRNYEYELAVLDWRMPGMSGLDVVRWIRRQQRPTPVLLLTARDAHADRVTGLDEGADDYLVKPFDFAELLARMRALQRRPATVQQPAIVVGDVEPGAAAEGGDDGRPAVVDRGVARHVAEETRGEKARREHPGKVLHQRGSRRSQGGHARVDPRGEDPGVDVAGVAHVSSG